MSGERMLVISESPAFCKPQIGLEDFVGQSRLKVLFCGLEWLLAFFIMR